LLAGAERGNRGVMPFAKVLHTVRLLGPRRFGSLVVDRLRHPNPIRPWETEPDFLRRAKEIADHTLVDPRRLFILYQLTKQTAALPGAIAEVGVYRGGTARFFAGLDEGRRPLYLFDTFEGMPETHPTHDFHRKGDFADTSLEAVRGYLSNAQNVTFRQGFFPQSAAGLEDQTFSLVHVDVDIYGSVRDCCDFFYPRMNPGGVMVFDDYGMLTCPGAKLALDEFCAAKGLTSLYLPSGQALLHKLA
jgi:O-methyltransferase